MSRVAAVGDPPVDVIRRWGGCPFTTDGVRAPTRPCNWRRSEVGASPCRPLDTVDLNLKCDVSVTLCSHFFGSQ